MYLIQQKRNHFSSLETLLSTSKTILRFRRQVHFHYPLSYFFQLLMGRGFKTDSTLESLSVILRLSTPLPEAGFSDPGMMELLANILVKYTESQDHLWSWGSMLNKDL